MNRLELEKQIIEEGLKRKIKVVSCQIYDREDCLEFCPNIINEYDDEWVYDHQVQELIGDLAPLERHRKIEDVRYVDRKFRVGEIVEMSDVYIRLDADEKEPDYIKVGTSCCTWRSGWVQGKVIETPEQNDRALVIKFPRDVWLNVDHKYFGCITELEKAIEQKKLVKIDKGQPAFCGTGWKGVRKVRKPKI